MREMSMGWEGWGAVTFPICASATTETKARIESVNLSSFSAASSPLRTNTGSWVSSGHCRSSFNNYIKEPNKGTRWEEKKVQPGECKPSSVAWWWDSKESGTTSAFSSVLGCGRSLGRCSERHQELVSLCTQTLLLAVCLFCVVTFP